MKRNISILLLLSVILSASSCGDVSVDTGTTADQTQCQTETTADPHDDDLPEMSYDGY